MSDKAQSSSTEAKPEDVQEQSPEKAQVESHNETEKHVVNARSNEETNSKAENAEQSPEADKKINADGNTEAKPEDVQEQSPEKAQVESHNETEKHVVNARSNEETNSKAENAEQSPEADKKINADGNTEEVSKVEDAENPIKQHDGTAEESEDEGIDGNEEPLDKAARDSLYEKGVQYDNKNKHKLALKCFLQCLKGLNGGAEFSYLPQCLRKVADLYFKQDELEKAIQFIQAEKMYYETALIDTSELQQKVEDRKRTQESQPSSSQDPNFSNPNIVRADEFENLARMCLDKKQSQLALEYQGKATKLRREVYGEAHEVTRNSLDFFTVIYGEVGKQQYSESMQKLTQPLEGGDTANGETTPEAAEGSPEAAEGSPEGASGSPTSILRKRKASEKPHKLQKRVSFVEPENSREVQEQEVWISKAILWVMFFICLAFLVLIFHYVYCKWDVRSHYCASLKSDFHYYYMRLKYLVYYYTTPADEDLVVG